MTNVIALLNGMPYLAKKTGMCHARIYVTWCILLASMLPVRMTAQVPAGVDSMQISAWRQKAESCLQSRYYDSTILYCDSILAAAPADSSARFLTTEAHFRHGQYAAAIAHLDTLQTYYPELWAIYLKKASAFYAMMDIPRATQNIERYVKKAPADPQGWYMYAIILEKSLTTADWLRERRSTYKRPIKFLDRAVELSSGKHTGALLELGNIHLVVHRKEQAMQYYQLAVQADTTRGLPHVMIGVYYLVEKDTTAALASFARALSLEPRDEQVVQAVNRQLLDMGYYDRVETYLDSVLATDSTSLPGLLGKAVMQLRLKNYVDALALANAAATLHPQAGQAYYLRAVCKYKLGRKDEANEDIRTAAKYGNPEARYIMKTDLSFGEAWGPFLLNLLSRVPWYLYY